MQEPNAILLVEDSEPDLVLIKRKVQSKWPHSDIISVHTLEEAFKACDQKRFDLVLLDLNLPDGFGADSVEEMRKYDGQVPIVVITGLSTDAIVSEAIRKGANNVVLKQQIFDGDFFNVLEQNAAPVKLSAGS